MTYSHSVKLLIDLRNIFRHNTHINYLNIVVTNKGKT